MPILPQKALQKANIKRQFLEKQSLNHKQA